MLLENYTKHIVNKGKMYGIQKHVFLISCCLYFECFYYISNTTTIVSKGNMYEIQKHLY